MIHPCELTNALEKAPIRVLASLKQCTKPTHQHPPHKQVYNRVRDGNFSLEGVAPGWDVKGKTVGVLGTGRIGEAFVWVMVGMGCRVLGYDVKENPRLLKLQERTRGVSAGDDDDGGAVGGSFEYASLEAIWPVRWDVVAVVEWILRVCVRLSIDRLDEYGSSETARSNSNKTGGRRHLPALAADPADAADHQHGDARENEVQGRRVVWMPQAEIMGWMCQTIEGRMDELPPRVAGSELL